VCDKQVHDPHLDLEESIQWSKWRAPMLMRMKPSLNLPYQAGLNWQRMDEEDTLHLLEYFQDSYVRALEIELEKAARQAEVELAKQPNKMKGDAVEITTKSNGTGNPVKDSEQVEANPSVRLLALRARVDSATPSGTLRTAEAAELLGVSTKTVNRRVRDRILTEGPRRGTVTIASIKRTLPKEPQES
jgi:hypothetical protein